MPERRKTQAKSRRPKVIIRPLRPIHLNAVLAIERRTFTDPWTPGWFIDAMVHSENSGTPEMASICWGCWRGGQLVGYIIALPFENSMHVANLAVTRRYRRQGLAQRMMRKLYRAAKARNFPQITLEARPSNTGALAFYQREGFLQIGMEKGYYNDGEYALIFCKSL